MSNFDPTKLNPPRSNSSFQSRGPRPERLFLVVDNYETPDDGFHYAVGHLAENPEKKVRVRLNTVAERAVDRPRDSEDKIRAQYVTGENTRDSIAEKAKANIKLIAFDDCRRIAEADGVTEYRAHWPKTISTQPNAELMTGKAHIRLRDAFEHAGGRAKAQAYIEMIKSHAVATADNVDQLMHDALTIKDSEGRARDPLAILRVNYQDKVVASPRLYPSLVTTKVFDQVLGESRDVGRPVDAEQTLATLAAAEPGRSDLQNRQQDSIRALMAGIKGENEPKFNSADPGILDAVRNLYYGAKAGQLTVEVISAEKIDFGADSRKTYLKDKDLPQLAAYVVKEAKDDQTLRESPGYTDTVIGILRHEDGEPFAVYASPLKMYPKSYKLADLHLPDAVAPTQNAEQNAAATQENEAEIPPMATDNHEEMEPEGPGM